jgi:hypothetical protein
MSFRRTHPETKALEMIPVELFLEIKKTGDNDEIIEICLPATPALQRVNEIAFVFGGQGQMTSVHMTLAAFEFQPL